MEAAVIDQVIADIDSADKALRFRANGSTILFDGFLKLYREDVDDPGEEEEGGRLPTLAERDALRRDKVTPSQHFTEPPPRYSEASLVKKLEELGIGRPSTYASIIQVLQDRDYVKLDKKRFIPEDRGRVVTAFLANFFERYVEYGFTADLENQLDEISDGKIPWRKVLEDFWRDFTTAIDGTKDLSITQVLDVLDQSLGRHFFPERADGSDPRLCPACNKGRLGLKLGKFGGFIGCSNYPECRYTRKLGFEGEDENGENGDAGPRALGIDPATGLPVSLRKGPYGNYVQLGEAEKGEKPKRASLPKGLAPADVDLEKALALLSLPREVGRHPEDGAPIVAGLGRFGPYIKHGDHFRSLAPDDDVLTVGINRAVSLLAEPRQARGRAQRESLKSFDHADGKIMLYKGRYGPYVSRDGVNATVPRDLVPEELTLEQALDLLAAQAAKGGTGKRRGRAAPKRAAPKKAAKAKSAAE
jgi:DNA topoisomerase-1